MFDLNTVVDFSHRYCIEICAFLVPANLLVSLQTMIFAGIKRPRLEVNLTAGVGSIYALVMLFHVFTWLVIGVVMAPTYILLCLGSICLGINIWAMVHPASMTRLVRILGLFLVRMGKEKFKIQVWGIGNW
ncbi:hypothetical protein BCD67_09100 [Oscillatoriales cyanobacterium USR001]|nr:hypothetical protein BCD67_09100 [Oscillatoriales cyanobacterium USR001]